MRLRSYYKKLYACFGPQHWWPGETPFEVTVGAILTQNTSWSNVRRAIDNLKSDRSLSPQRMHKMPLRRLARLIRPAGYFNVKARRLKNFLDFLFVAYQGDLQRMFRGRDGRRRRIRRLREELLSLNGIGEETADSIILYAAGMPIFVVDAYTRRIFSRHGIIEPQASYREIQDVFMDALPADSRLFNEFHALIVRLGKEFCRKNKPRCQECPLGDE
ncbi:MAG: endonuclease III domain-containing protein [Candidatus Omnitrophota bacterium]